MYSGACLASNGKALIQVGLDDTSLDRGFVGAEPLGDLP